jgi:hypothetical protein
VVRMRTSSSNIKHQTSCIIHQIRKSEVEATPPIGR